MEVRWMPVVPFVIWRSVEQHGKKSENKEDDGSKFLMLRDTNIAIFNFIEQHEESENQEDGESKFLMLRQLHKLYLFCFLFV